MTEPTPRQLEVLAFMRQFLAEQDQMPTVRALADHFGWSSCNSSQTILVNLARKGLIERNVLGGWRFTRMCLSVEGSA